MPDLQKHSSKDADFNPKAEAALLGERVIRRAARLIGGGDHREIVSSLCATLTHETEHIRLVWTWFGQNDATLVTPQIISGPAVAYASSLTIDSSPVMRSGPAHQAMTGRRSPPKRITADSPFEPWRRAAVDFGIQSVLALPLRSTVESECGIFVLYADTPTYFDDVGLALFESLAELFGALLAAASDRQSLRATARSDALTGLGNRYLASEVERSIFRVDDSSPKAVVLLLDLDHFKSVNDEHGHDTGDRVLKDVARLLQACVRGRDWVLRWGGEEFLVCLPDTALEEGVRAAEKIREALSAAAFAEGKIRGTVSIGVAEIAMTTSLAATIRRADEALYAAKRAGRNCVRYSRSPA